MNKKKLPKAIIRTNEEVPEAVAGFSATGPQMSSADASALALGSPLAGVAPGDNVIEIAPRPEATSSVADALPLATLSPADVQAARRRSVARTIVDRHAAYSAVGGFIPLPIANVASITAVVVRMVKMLSALYGLPFEHDRARTIVVGLVAGAMPTGLGAVTSSTLLYVVPASAVVGLAVSSISAAACTRSIGRIFVEHFESGATLIDFPATERA